MNGEVPSVPITTLAGITSLTNLLSELPLPTPLPSTVQNKSLLHNAQLAELAREYINNPEDGLTQQLVFALQQTSSENIELKDAIAGEGIPNHDSRLLQDILIKDPNVFLGSKAKAHRSHKSHHSPSAQQSQAYSNSKVNQSHGPTKSGDGASHSSSSPSSSTSPACYPDAYQSYPHAAGTIGSINGEHPITPEASRHHSSKHSNAKGTPPVASPAQATVAEPAGQKHVSQKPDAMSRSTTGHRSEKQNSAHRSRAEPWDSLKAIEKKILDKKLETKNRDTKSKEKPGGPVVLLEPLDAQILKSIKFGGSVTTKSEKHSGKRRYEEDDDEDSSLSSRKRQKSKNYYEDSMDEDSQTYSPAPEVRKKKKEKKHRRINEKTLTVEELLESPTFKKFSSAMEYILENAEDVNFGNLDPNDEETESPPETLIARNILTELCGEAAKLKALGVLNQVPVDKLLKLMTILQWNIRDGTKVLPTMTQDVEDEEEQRLWREVTMERVIRSMDSALTALYLMTSKDMPKQVYLEDVIERIILFGKFQLQNTIFPEYDPVYKIDPKGKDGYHGSLKLKRARAGQVKHKSIINLYNKMVDLVGNLAELVYMQDLTDTTILQMSTFGVCPFFVENISEMQLNSMKLVTVIFSKYEKHRQLILEDIFASLARLPSSKRNLRNYRLNSEESIQMVTALALQLIQCVVKLPYVAPSSRPSSPVDEEGTINLKKNQKRKSDQDDQDVVIITSFENSMRTGYNFLSVFLKKCTVKGEEDYRPLFENFVQDLLTTVNKPEWPSSELLLSLLGRILVKQFSNKSVDMSLRVASLEYLGIVASRLRKDAVSSQLNTESIAEIVEKVENDSDDEDSPKKSKGDKNTENSGDQTESLQRAMLQYLTFHSPDEPAYWFACQFYIAQWYRDTSVEAEKKAESKDEQAEDFDETEAEVTTEVLHNAERRKKFLLQQVEATHREHNSHKPPPSSLNYDDACLIARYLSSKRPFAQSFDIYLTQILRVLSETAVAVRTKAMKCLTAVVESDPGILARSDMQKGVRGRFLDSSTMVREAAVELVGRFILIRPELIPKYYEMLNERILDTGISVRKRVIKIFRDICLGHSDFEKIPEMCVKMIRRVNDEEGIKKLVNEVFQTMWFTPISAREKNSSKLFQRVVHITDVVAACKDTGLEFFEQMLEHLLKKDEEGNYNKSALTACEQIVDCLVENVLVLEEKSVDASSGRGCSQRLCACLSTLHLFSKIKADLMVKHATTLQPYLELRCNSQNDTLVLHYVARILEMVVPLMDHPSDTFLAQLEEDMMKLILKHGMMVLQSCVSCLGAVVNHVSHNYALVKDCFQKFFGVLWRSMQEHKENPSNPVLQQRKPTLMRSLFTVGLFCKHFDLDSKEMGETKASVKEKVFEVLCYFIAHEDKEISLKALMGLGFMVVRHYDYMLIQVFKEMYMRFLNDEEVNTQLRVQVLKNIQYYLQEEEVRMQRADAEWRKHSKEEDLKEMGDVQSGMASTVMQVYLKEVLEAYFHASVQIRIASLGVISLVLRQGLVHPVQCVPYLISMSTDTEAGIRVKADQQIQEIEKKYPGFVHMKALQGLKLSYRLQQILQNHSDCIRGMRGPVDNIQSLNTYLYTVLRSNRSHRRAILASLLNLFDDSARISLAEQVYIADNLAYFPYQTQDEPMYIIHQVDIIVSVSGSNLLQSFKEKLNPKTGERHMGLATSNGVDMKLMDEDDDDDEDSYLNRLPEDVSPLREICRLSQGVILLLHLKQHLKELYGFTDSKLHNYSPSDTKANDKPVTRKFQVQFQPESVIEALKEEIPEEEDEESKRKLVNEFLEFKELMHHIDPPDEDEEPDEGKVNEKGSADTAKPSEANQERGGGGDGEGESTMDTTEIASVEKENIEETPVKEEKPPPPIISSHNSHSVSRFTKHHHLLHGSSDKKKKMQSSHVSSSNSHSSSRTSLSTSFSSTPKSTSKKKSKKRKKRYASDSDDDSDDDPDFVL